MARSKERLGAKVKLRFEGKVTPSLVKARDNLDAGQYDKAIKNYSKAITLNPNSAGAYNDRGYAKLHLGQNEEAISDFNKAVELEPDFAFAYNNLGAAKYRLGQYEEAVIDSSHAIRFDPRLAHAYFNRGLAREQLGKGFANLDYETAATLLLENEEIPNKQLMENIFLNSEESCKKTAQFLLDDKENSLSFLEKLSKLEEKVLKEIIPEECFLLAKCLGFGNKCGLRVFKDNGSTSLRPYYTLSEVKGRRIFGEFPPMLREDKGSIIAIPKFTKDGGRTCWLPDFGIELKGIGTIHGKPKGDYGARVDNEDLDPIGGMIKEKAIYEHLANVYLYIAGVDVPEPLGVAMPYKIRGPRNKTLAVLARKPKTHLRGDDLLYASEEVMAKVAENLQKMHWLGLVHYWYHGDNFNSEGQLLDLEGVRVALEWTDKLDEEAYIIRENSFGRRANTFSVGKQTILGISKFHIEGYSERIRDNTAKSEIYSLCEETGIRLMPQELTDNFAFFFTDKKEPIERIQETMRDPRDIIGEYAKKHLDSLQKKVREEARLLYSRYKKDLKETKKVALRFQKEIDYVKKNFC